MENYHNTQSRLASRQPYAPPPPVLLDEVIVEILSWLPVKPLVRFRCVSKSWKSLISDPQFVKLHLHRSATNTDVSHHRLVFERICNYQRYAITCSVSSLLQNPSVATAEEEPCYQLKEEYKVLGSCHGLICLLGYVSKQCLQCWVRLLNPATRLSSKSPSFYVDSRSFRINFTSFGFGYDHLSDTFKVVAVLYDLSDREDSFKTDVKVYSMGDNSWRNIQSFPAVPSLRQDDGVYLSGTLNWVAVRNFSSRYEWESVYNDRFVIVSLDLGMETCRQLLLPHIPHEDLHVEPGVRVLRDCLCVYHDYNETHFVVWQMKEFGVEKSWTQLLNVSYLDLQIFLGQFPSMLPLCMSENGDVVMVLGYAGSQAILYNKRDNRLEHYKVPSNIYWKGSKLYVESLVSPCSRFT